MTFGLILCFCIFALLITLQTFFWCCIVANLVLSLSLQISPVAVGALYAPTFPRELRTQLTTYFIEWVTRCIPRQLHTPLRIIWVSVCFLIAVTNGEALKFEAAEYAADVWSDERLRAHQASLTSSTPNSPFFLKMLRTCFFRQMLRTLVGWCYDGFK